MSLGIYRVDCVSQPETFEKDGRKNVKRALLLTQRICPLNAIIVEQTGLAAYESIHPGDYVCADVSFGLNEYSGENWIQKRDLYDLVKLPKHF